MLIHPAAIFLAQTTVAPLPAPMQEQEHHILVHVDSQGYEHAVAKAGEDGMSLVEQSWMEWAAADSRFSVTVDRGYARFTDQGLAQFDAVFFYTTGELPMDASQKSALLDFLREGGAFVGSHCAADTFYQWPAYGAMLGGIFDGHPWHQEVRLVVEDAVHPATRHLRSGFSFRDEIYQFRAPYDRDRLHVLLSLDTASVSVDLETVNRTDGDFALAWERAEGKGAVFYTALGHRAEVWQSDWFRDHLIGGSLAACDAPPSTPTGNPQGFRQEFAPGISLEFVPIPAADGSTFWISTTEVPWELYDLFFLREDQQVQVDGITGPSRSVFPVTRGYGHDGIPALGMTLHAAQEFCKWATVHSERTFHLPDEKQWRRAAGPTPSAKALPSVAWFSDNADDHPHPVADLEPNALGLYDMFGNVAEWVPGDHPRGVALGGSFLSDANAVGADARAPYALWWQDRDPQWPKSRWWMSDAGFVGFRMMTLEGPLQHLETHQ